MQDVFLQHLPDYIIDVTHPFVHDHCVLVWHHFVGKRANREQCRVEVDPQLLKNAAPLVLQSHHLPRFASRNFVGSHH